MAIINPTMAGASNLGMGIEWIFIFVVLGGAILFYTKSFIMGAVVQFVLSAGLFVLFYSLNWNHVPALIFTFLSAILMVFALYGKYQEKGVGIA